MATPLPLLWIGQTERAEWRSLHARLAELSGVTAATQPANWAVCRNLDAVEAWLPTTDSPPELVIVAQSWPDEFSTNDVARLLGLLPLARCVCVSGAWCEAVGRTRDHWPPALRVPWWLAESRIAYELKVISGIRPALPWTATRDEVWLALSTERDEETPVTSGSAHVELSDPVLCAWLSDALRSRGWTVVDDPTATVSTLFLAAEPATPEALLALAQRCRDVAPAQVVAVTTWPLPEWAEQLRAVGVHAVWNPLEVNTSSTIADAVQAAPVGQAVPDTE